MFPGGLDGHMTRYSSGVRDSSGVRLGCAGLGHNGKNCRVFKLSLKLAMLELPARRVVARPLIAGVFIVLA